MESLAPFLVGENSSQYQWNKFCKSIKPRRLRLKVNLFFTLSVFSEARLRSSSDLLDSNQLECKISFRPFAASLLVIDSGKQTYLGSQHQAIESRVSAVWTFQAPFMLDRAHSSNTSPL